MKFPAKIIQLPGGKVTNLIKHIGTEIKRYGSYKTLQLDKEGGHISYDGGCAVWALEKIKEKFEKKFSEETTSSIVLLERMKPTHQDYDKVKGQAAILQRSRTCEPKDRQFNLTAFEMLDYNYIEGSLLLFKLLEKREQEENENLRQMLLFMIELCTTHERIKYSKEEKYKGFDLKDCKTGKSLSNKKITDVLCALGEDYKDILKNVEKSVEYDPACFNAFYEIYTAIADTLHQCVDVSEFNYYKREDKNRFFGAIKRIIKCNFDLDQYLRSFNKTDVTDLLFLLIGSFFSLKHQNDYELEKLLIKKTIDLLVERYELTFDVEKKYSTTLEYHTFQRASWSLSSRDYKDSTLRNIIDTWPHDDNRKFLLNKSVLFPSDQKKEKPDNGSRARQGGAHTNGDRPRNGTNTRSSGSTFWQPAKEKKETPRFSPVLNFNSMPVNDAIKTALEVLGLTLDFPFEGLGSARRGVLKKYHSDKVKTEEEEGPFKIATQNINNAYDYLQTHENDFLRLQDNPQPSMR